MSCEDEEDNAIKLTVNTSAYDVVKGLKSVDGNLLFTGELTDGLQLRFTYLVLKQGEEEVSIVFLLSTKHHPYKLHQKHYKHLHFPHI